jgi:DNA polymerase-3 subunit gamma/tau
MADYKALYRKWRPRDFDDVCGQSGITDILKYEVNNGKLSHAYLFCGSRGTGKTSCAKILAKAVNCESPINGNPCNKCSACKSIGAGLATDVIEMDAASNNGIDTVRDLQDELAFTPAEFKYRVYIIDEVHMMSGQAFNALLKTLEEPPEYVIFILATTEYNKLPTTIVSRCQRFDFKRIDTNVIINRLLKISSEEGIEITEDAARVIARIARGGMRDAISLLELCAGAHALIDEDLVFATVGGGNRDSAYQIIRAIGKSDYSSVYRIINDIVMSSGDIAIFGQEILDAYRDIMVAKNSDRAKTYLDLTDAEYQTL